MTAVLTQPNNQIHKHEESVQRRLVRFVADGHSFAEGELSDEVPMLGSQSLPPGLIISKIDRRNEDDRESSAGTSRDEISSSTDWKSKVRGPLVRRYEPYESDRRIEVVHQWECVVTNVDERGDSIEVDLYDLQDSTRPLESGDLSLREIPPSDRPHILPGTILYWSVGYEQDNAGTYRRVSEFRRKRMPNVTDRMERNFKKRAAGFADTFGVISDGPTQSNDD